MFQCIYLKFLRKKEKRSITLSVYKLLTKEQQESLHKKYELTILVNINPNIDEDE